VIAFALGSLSRTQPEGSLLLGSTWLVYVVYLAPLLVFGLVIVMIAYTAFNWRYLSDALGLGLARRRKAARKKKQSSIIKLVVWMSSWAVAILVLTQKCGGIFCNTQGQAPVGVDKVVSGSVSGPQLPFLVTVAQLSSIVQSNWFLAAFLGFLVVSTVIVARGIIVSWNETRSELVGQLAPPTAEGIASVEDAFRILEARTEADPRTRIINCYMRMVQSAQRLGASITSDQTARELEMAIRKMLVIKGSSMRELTDLFEEARYSLHPIIEDDADQAQQCLLDIAHEMNISLSV